MPIAISVCGVACRFDLKDHFGGKHLSAGFQEMVTCVHNALHHGFVAREEGREGGRNEGGGRKEGRNE